MLLLPGTTYPRERELFSFFPSCWKELRVLKRSINARLNLQHYLWKDQTGFLLHPTIPLDGRPNLKIADVGTGTGYANTMFFPLSIVPASLFISFRVISPCNSYKNIYPQNISTYHHEKKKKDHALNSTPRLTPQYLAPRPSTHTPPHGATRRFRHRHIRLPGRTMAAAERSDAASRRFGADTSRSARRVRYRASAVVSGGG